jgi:chromosome segregation ATPase
MKSLKDCDKAADALRAELAGAQSELSAAEASIRDREKVRDVLVISKSDASAAAEWNRLGKEIDGQKEKLAFLRRRIELFPGQLKALETDRNAIISKGLRDQSAELLERFNALHGEAVEKVREVMLTLRPQLNDIHREMERIADKHRELVPGVKVPTTPTLSPDAEEYIGHLAYPFLNGTGRTR